MDGVVMFVGWATIIIGVIFALGTLAGKSNDAKIEAAGKEVAYTNKMYRLAARKIYFENDDDGIREKVKAYANMYLSGWALLELDMSDEAYRIEYDTYQAEQQIKKEGLPLVLVDGELVPTWQLSKETEVG